MKYRKHLIITLLLCSVIIFWTGCQKDDIYDNATKADVDADTFFHYGERDMLVADIIDFLREKNDSSEFITVFSQQYGNPEWQKAVISENEEYILLFVPITKRALKNVETIWLFKISDNYIEYYPVSKSNVVQNDLWTFDYFTQEVYNRPFVNGVRYVLGEKRPSSKGWVTVTVGVEGFIGVEYNGNFSEFSTGWHYWSFVVFTQFNPDENIGGGGYDYGSGEGYFNGGGGGGGNPPPAGSELNSNLKKLFKGENNLSNEDTDKLNEAYEDMRENCFYETIDNYLMQNGVQLNNINMNPNYGGQAGINNHGDLTFWNSANINSENLSHEWIHLFQKEYHNMTLFGDNVGMMEFEVALIQDILIFIEVGGKWKIPYAWACFSMGKDEYQEAYIAWLKAMTNNGTSYPSTIDINNFLFFSNVFGDVSIPYNKNRGYIYGNATYGTSAIQELFNLANQNCNK